MSLSAPAALGQVYSAVAEQTQTPKRGRGRPPKKGKKIEEEKQQPQQGVEEEGENERAEDSNDEGDGTDTPKTKARKVELAKSKTPVPAPAPAVQFGSIPVDIYGNPLPVVNDELLLPEDPEGETKITPNGELLDDRDYRVRVFTVLGRGNRLYMLSTEPARCMGFRDSYLLFQKHKRLHKIIIPDDEKFDLIERELIPHSYKGRAIGIVTARSVFREFGARIIIGGKRIIDDYYVQEARDAGFVEGQLADPDDRLPLPGEPYNKNQYVAWHGASAVYHQYANPPIIREPIKSTEQSSGTTSSFVMTRKLEVNDENWMYTHASSAQEFNVAIRKHRSRAAKSSSNGVPTMYEPLAGITFYPKITQPNRTQWKAVESSGEKTQSGEEEDSDKKKVTVETIMRWPNLAPRTGLVNVDESIFEHVDPAIKAEIKLQQERERAWL